ncbi:GTPase Era [Holzapfeliella floricola]|uniref:GTPase Era n=1 Tax=Holzapfeliella floricola DSM 23037 = JCM 16512 TaxID=1423744 RepID=A0A0R2DUL5_9LACO|nr:GTPase Era [Holzapfeliella floricola]KRN03764.1 era protein [Holzapfeliella floricola DSM 23037 = JCM 16512]
MENNEFRSGFVGIIGRPNVGKSTLMNRIIGEKIAIMSEKAQTTRNNINGIYTSEKAQMVFLDTPGVHKPKNQLDDFMSKSSLGMLNQVDVILFMVSAEDKMGPGDRFILNLLQDVKKPVYLIINKIDLVHPDDLLAYIEQYRHELDFKEVYPISAIQGNNVEELLDQLGDELPVGPQFYDEDQLTDRPEYFVVAELIREKILEFTHDEIPHSVAVLVNQMSERIEGKLQIDATIFVERNSQKAIVIGQGASLLKRIGIKSRQEIENLLGEKINLKLWVKVQKNWRKDPLFLAQSGYNPKDLS